MKRFLARKQDLYVPTEEEVRKNREQIEEYIRLGLPYREFGEKFEFTRDELIAMKCIHSNKEIPTDVEKRLLETKDERLSKRHTESFDIIPTEKDLALVDEIMANKKRRSTK